MTLLRLPGTDRAALAAPLLCAALSALSSMQCLEQPLEPVAPAWDLRLTLPLANRTHALSEIVLKDTSMLHAGAGGIISYGATLQVPPTFVGDLISIRPPDTTAAIRLGPFHVSTPALSTPLAVPWLPGGAVIPIPDTTIQFPDVQADLPTFESVTFAEGAMQLTVANNLPVPVVMAEPVTLSDNLGRVIAVFVFAPAVIPGNSSRVATDDLAGKTTTHLLTMSGLSLHVQASPGVVPIPTGDLFVLTLSAVNARARRAVLADIPPQRLANNDSAALTLDDSTLVKEVRFAGGDLRFDFSNHVNLPMRCKFRMEELFRGSGPGRVAYEDSIMLPAGGAGTLDIHLAGCTIQSADGNLVRSLRTVTSVILPAGSGVPVTVSDTDRVDIRLTTTSPLLVDTAVAVLRPTWIDVNVPVAVDFGELPTRFSGDLNIPAAQLGLSTAVSFGFPVDLYLVVGARTSASGGWSYLPLPATQKRIQPGASTVQFDAAEVGGFLSAFSGHLPDTLFIIGQILVNPPEVYTPSLAGAGGVGRRSAFEGAVAMDVPLMLGIANGSYRDTLIIGDTTGDGAADFTVDRSRLHDILNGIMYVDVTNNLPLSVDVQVQLLDGARQPLLAVPRPGEHVGVGPASVDAQGGVSAPASGRSSILLNSADVRAFDAVRYVVYTLSFATTPGAGAVRFRMSDDVHVRIWSSLSYRVNG
jgi:hypothetical protein